MSTLNKFHIDLDSLLTLQGLGVFWKDISGRYLGCNSVISTKLNFASRHDIEGMSDFDLPIRKCEADALHHGDLQVIKSATAMQFDYSINQNHEVIRFSTFKAPLFDEYGKIVGIYGIDNYQFANLLKPHSTLSKDKLKNNLKTNLSLIHKDTHETLTLAQQQSKCLMLLIAGYSSKQIANKLGLSSRTVDYYLQHIRKILGCASSKEMITTYYSQIVNKFSY